VLVALVALVGCASFPEATNPGDDPDSPTDTGTDTGTDAGRAEPEPDPAPADPWLYGPPLGARRFANGDLEFRVLAPNATRVEVALFAEPLGEAERLRIPLSRPSPDAPFSIVVEAQALDGAGLGEATPFYGLRVFGPNWPFDPAWEPGSNVGFLEAIDDQGNRMNPNKLVLDPYVLELSHDPINPNHTDFSVFLVDEENRFVDSGPFAPKGVIIDVPEPLTTGPQRSISQEVVYEVHLRGLTRADPAVPESLRGTYAGAALKAEYLAELGVTAIEFLPLHDTRNEQNELTDDARGDNYWGYQSQSFFAPDRRYSADQSPGGPSREVRAMAEAFHAAGIKVYLDVVYNHYAEGSGNTMLSFKGVDNATYYQLANDPRRYVNSNGVSANVNTANPLVGDLVVDSLRYNHEQLGFDGYRFDLASVVGNGCTRECYQFDPDGLIRRIADELARDAQGQGIDLIAEPWGVAPGTYQMGNYPPGWSEWNDRFRDAVRRDLNRVGSEVVTLRDLSRRIGGSPDLVGDDGRPPSASINFVTAHDGFTLRDLFRYDRKQNQQPWPYGPSNGGSDNNLSFDHGSPEARATLARTSMALLMLSAGVPMILGGDEFLRTRRGNNNPFNIDSIGSWLPWVERGEAIPDRNESFFEFTRQLLAFRGEHAAFRPVCHWDVCPDRDADGRAAVRWLDDAGRPAADAYLDAPDRHFLAYELDGGDLGDATAALLIAYNGWTGTVNATLPPPPAGHRWHLRADTSAAAAAFGHWHTLRSAPAVAGAYAVAGRALALFEALPADESAARRE